MRVRRTVKEKDVIKIWVFGYDRKLIKSATDSGFRSMVSNENRGWCGSYTIYGREID